MTPEEQDWTLQRLEGGGVSGNHFDIETREEYRISGIKKDGHDAHWASRIRVEIDPDAIDEYQPLLRKAPHNKPLVPTRRGPGGHFNFLHPWPGQNPPLEAAERPG
jgi:hypothetical protein